MITAAIGFIAAGLLLAMCGEFIRRGHTWLIAGYDPTHVSDEPGLAKFCGTSLLLMGAVAAFAGGLAATLPETFAFLSAALFVANTLIGPYLVFLGARRFTKRTA